MISPSVPPKYSPASTNNISSASPTEPNQRGLATHLQEVRNGGSRSLPANPPPYPNDRDRSAQQHFRFMTRHGLEAAGTGLDQIIEQRRPVSLPPSFGASQGNVQGCFDQLPAYSDRPREGEFVLERANAMRTPTTVVERGPVGSVELSEICPALSVGHRQQAQKHITKIDKKIEKFDQLIEHVRSAQESGIQGTISELDFSSARDAMVTLRNAWAEGSVKGSSLKGMKWGLAGANQRRKQLEQSVRALTSRLVTRADYDSRQRMFDRDAGELAANHTYTALKEIHAMDI